VPSRDGERFARLPNWPIKGVAPLAVAASLSPGVDKSAKLLKNALKHIDSGERRHAT
jgi:hypothetical protein